MRGRKYNRKIELWQTTRTKNEFGDSIVTSELLITTWAEIKVPNLVSANYRSMEFGITDTSNRLVINLRKRNDITFNSKNMYFVYNNDRYNIISEPVNVGFENREISMSVAKVPNSTGASNGNGAGNQHQHQNGQGGN